MSSQKPESFPPQLHLYTGDGKGKTTAAVGLAVRALGRGLKVEMIQFDKGPEGAEHYSERKILAGLPGMKLVATGLERMRPGEKFRFGATPEDKAEAERALNLARAALFDGDSDLLILDEILSAVGCGLVKEDDVVSLAEEFRQSRPRELVMTGRGASDRLIELADLATEMTCIKHYFNEGIPARPGIDY